MRRQYNARARSRKRNAGDEGSGENESGNSRAFRIQGQYVVKEWIKRYYWRERKLEAGILPKRRGLDLKVGGLRCADLVSVHGPSRVFSSRYPKLCDKETDANRPIVFPRIQAYAAGHRVGERC